MTTNVTTTDDSGHKKQKLCTVPLPEIDFSSLSKYSEVNLSSNKLFNALCDNDQKVVHLMCQASAIMDELFLEQSCEHNTEWKRCIDKESNHEKRTNLLRFWDINMGVFDRLSDDAHALGKPRYANYYPPDMTVDEFNKWVSSLPVDQAAEAKGFYHIIRRDNKNNLIAIPYSEYFKKPLLRCAKLLCQASELSTNKSLSAFLVARADAFISNDYVASDIKWLSVDKSSPIEVTLGPYEVYEDELLAQKAAFESFICLTDFSSSEKVQLFSMYLQELENNLPCEKKFRNPKIVQGNPIVVVDQIFAGGDRGGPMTAAFNLPNDEKVTTKYGNKLVILHNVQQAKFKHVLKPIAAIVIHQSQREFINFDSFFTHILCHEVCHSLGPHNLDPNETGGAKTVREALGALHSGLEEAKADIVGLWALLYLMLAGKLPQLDKQSIYVTFLASAFRSIRFGLEESHGKGQALQLNFIMDEGGFEWDKSTQTVLVNFDKIESAVEKCAQTVLNIQGAGDAKRANALLQKYAINRDFTKILLEKLKKVPVDISPMYDSRLRKETGTKDTTTTTTTTITTTIPTI